MDKSNCLLLKPSSIEGIGVFADCSFDEGETIPVWIEGDYRKISNPTGQELAMCEIYCIPEGDDFHCPLNFNGMSVGWYLNHSDHPNATMINDECVAIMKINSGQEITIDYSVLYY